ncbi:IS5 family transposase [Nonomuraea sp. NPDC050328]|uniref:IS5 family transposase n=1 Tax=Nonomuraea sp. NPDC050328 TaxID=3364361 RepID=UPI0037B4D6EE
MAASPSGAPPWCGPSCTGSCWTRSARAESWTGLDARSTRSACGRSKGGVDEPESCRSRQEGSKIHLIADRTGLPISVAISAANTHDSLALEPLIRSIPPIRSRRGPRPPQTRQAPRRQGYDYPHLRAFLRGRGIIPRIARRGIESSQRLGRHRWVVERTVSWLAGCRRLHRRYERRADHFASFVALAAALICYRRITK